MAAFEDMFEEGRARARKTTAETRRMLEQKYEKPAFMCGEHGGAHSQGGDVEGICQCVIVTRARSLFSAECFPPDPLSKYKIHSFPNTRVPCWCWQC